MALFKSVISGYRRTDTKALGWGINEYDNALGRPNRSAQRGADGAGPSGCCDRLEHGCGSGPIRGRTVHTKQHQVPRGQPADPGLRLVQPLQRGSGLGSRQRDPADRQAARLEREEHTIVMVVAAANGVEVNNGPRYFYIEAAKDLPGFVQVTPAQITATTTTIGGTRPSRSTARARSTARTQRRRTSSAISRRATTSCSTLLMTTATSGLPSSDPGGLGEGSSTYRRAGGRTRGAQRAADRPELGVRELRVHPGLGSYVLAEAAAIHQGVTPPMLTPSPEVG